MALLIKSINGLAYGSCKSRNGLAVASIKSINGLDATSASLAAFSDDFNRADSASLGANWTEVAGDASIASSKYNIVTSGFGVVTSIYSATACNTVNQYIKATLGVINVQYPWLVFRYTDSSSPYYAFQLDGNNGTFQWYKYDNAADTEGTEIGTAVDVGAGLVSGETFGITITGSGANTDVRIWRDVTGLPSAADNWNGDTSPDATWLTTDPGASAVDTGNYLGIGGQSGSANTLTLDGFSGGDIP
jgi:hypothetical protein